VEIAGNASSQALPSPVLTHLIQFRVSSSRMAPGLPSGTGQISLFASKDGQDVLAAWSEPTRAVYRISNGNTWDELREIRFSENIDRAKAYEILEQKVKNR
jgi:predicted RNA methylase